MLLFKKPAARLLLKQWQSVLTSCTFLMVSMVHRFSFNIGRTFLNKSHRRSVKYTLYFGSHVTR